MQATTAVMFCVLYFNQWYRCSRCAISLPSYQTVNLAVHSGFADSLLRANIGRHDATLSSCAKRFSHPCALPSYVIFQVDELKGLRRQMLLGLTKDLQKNITKVGGGSCRSFQLAFPRCVFLVDRLRSSSGRGGGDRSLMEKSKWNASTIDP